MDRRVVIAAKRVCSRTAGKEDETISGSEPASDAVDRRNVAGKPTNASAAWLMKERKLFAARLRKENEIAVSRSFLGVIYCTLKNNRVFADFPNFVLTS